MPDWTALEWLGAGAGMATIVGGGVHRLLALSADQRAKLPGTGFVQCLAWGHCRGRIASLHSRFELARSHGSSR